jgi:hypothetical protein
LWAPCGRLFYKKLNHIERLRTIFQASRRNRGLTSHIGLRGSFADLLEHSDKAEIERCKSLDGYLCEIMIDVTLVTRSESDDEAHSLYRAIAIKE